MSSWPFYRFKLHLNSPGKKRERKKRHTRRKNLTGTLLLQRSDRRWESPCAGFLHLIPKEIPGKQTNNKQTKTSEHRFPAVLGQLRKPHSPGLTLEARGSLLLQRRMGSACSFWSQSLGSLLARALGHKEVGSIDESGLVLTRGPPELRKIMCVSIKRP